MNYIINKSVLIRRNFGCLGDNKMTHLNNTLREKHRARITNTLELIISC